VYTEFVSMQQCCKKLKGAGVSVDDFVHYYQSVSDQ